VYAAGPGKSGPRGTGAATETDGVGFGLGSFALAMIIPG
jgi:hypothetical protein